MTGLQRPVRRKTNEVHRGRQLVIELAEGGRLVRIREAGRRTSYTVTYRQILMMGAQNKATEIRLAKLAAKKLRKKSAS